MWGDVEMTHAKRKKDANGTARCVGIGYQTPLNRLNLQLSAALQFDMAEVFHMTTEGIRGRIMMLGHAKAQGFAPPDADRLLMFLNLELKERAAGREIAVKVLEEELESKATTAAPTPRDSPTPRKEPSQHPAKSVPAAASAVPAPSFSGPSASKPSSSSAPASAIASSSAAREANDRPPAASRAVEPEGAYCPFSLLCFSTRVPAHLFHANEFPPR
jgi:hypothetical protein